MFTSPRPPHPRRRRSSSSSSSSKSASSQPRLNSTWTRPGAEVGVGDRDRRRSPRHVQHRCRRRRPRSTRPVSGRSTLTSRPTLRRQCRGRVSGRSTPGELTSSWYSPATSSPPVSSAASSAAETARDTSATASRLIPPSRVDHDPHHVPAAGPGHGEVLQVVAGGGDHRLDHRAQPGPAAARSTAGRCTGPTLASPRTSRRPAGWRGHAASSAHPFPNRRRPVRAAMPVCHRAETPRRLRRA